MSFGHLVVLVPHRPGALVPHRPDAGCSRRCPGALIVNRVLNCQTCLGSATWSIATVPRVKSPFVAAWVPAVDMAVGSLAQHSEILSLPIRVPPNNPAYDPFRIDVGVFVAHVLRELSDCVLATECHLLSQLGPLVVRFPQDAFESWRRLCHAKSDGFGEGPRIESCCFGCSRDRGEGGKSWRGVLLHVVSDFFE